MRSIGTLMGTVQRVCAILSDSHSATFQRSTNQREKAFNAEKCLKGGSKDRETLDFQNFDRQVDISQKYEKRPF